MSLLFFYLPLRAELLTISTDGRSLVSLLFFSLIAEAGLTISSLSCGFFSYIEVDHFNFLEEENSPTAQ